MFPGPASFRGWPLKLFVCFFITLIYNSLETHADAVSLQVFICEDDKMNVVYII